MGHKIVSDGVELEVDPQALFQRLLVIANNSDIDIDIDGLMCYELSVYPPSMFTSSGVPRNADKPQLVDAIAKDHFAAKEVIPVAAECTVFDGGSLLRRIQWDKGETYAAIASRYVCNVKKYPSPVIVFDGYENLVSTKESTHKKRAKGVTVAPDVQVRPHHHFTLEKDSFLANKKQ